MVTLEASESEEQYHICYLTCFWKEVSWHPAANVNIEPLFEYPLLYIQLVSKYNC